MRYFWTAPRMHTLKIYPKKLTLLGTYTSKNLLPNDRAVLFILQ